MTTYTHDCSACIALGSHTYDAPLTDGNTQRMTVDLYYCWESGTRALGGSVIARYGSVGSDYASCPTDIVKTWYESPRLNHSTCSPALVEAYRRALVMVEGSSGSL